MVFLKIYFFQLLTTVQYLWENDLLWQYLRNCSFSFRVGPGVCIFFTSAWKFHFGCVLNGIPIYQYHHRTGSVMKLFYFFFWILSNFYLNLLLTLLPDIFRFLAILSFKDLVRVYRKEKLRVSHYLLVGILNYSKFRLFEIFLLFIANNTFILKF